MTYYVDEEPVLGFDSILIEEECSTGETLAREIRREICKPPEYVIAGASLEHEDRDHLLCEEADNDSLPLNVRPVFGRCPKSKLEYE
jgi:hypothetical protein